MTAPDVDPYLDPGTGILRNKVHAVTWDELKAEEADEGNRWLHQLDPVK
ncbi:hypothetical protein IEU95_01765 [Hoyosella rhizosphaerae]|uniref:Uncharacterized protein n=1 Tax=Hoyosella rhizosphaerae TaxID=1755582 RepID=A0A916UDU1_9ACTN|nr:hypothetical protein [Hoyosella rhizosphaerae]MBN4925542.1 hypothetical protein [Hoyosella rhizosphaerae]GGC69846.1 hypothetical protein GCM10011410_23330 [Hoyosella rhizosphaerae]